MQVGPIKPTLKAPVTKRLKVKYYKVLSRFAFNVKLRRYTKVQRAAASALRTLAFKNDENKNQIVECGALPMLIFMVRSEDQAIHYEVGRFRLTLSNLR